MQTANQIVDNFLFEYFQNLRQKRETRRRENGITESPDSDSVQPYRVATLRP
jgi:hypothetical protein